MDKKVSVKVCLGTTCFVMGSANLQELIELVPKKYGDRVDVSAEHLNTGSLVRLQQRCAGEAHKDSIGHNGLHSQM